jgi:hypothetical protein
MRKNTVRKKNQSALSKLLLLFFVSLILGITLTSFAQNHFPPSNKINASTPGQEAKKIYNKCFEHIEQEPCFANEFYNLTKKEDSAHAVKTLLKLQQIDPIYTRGCHLIAHKISQAQTEKNPSKWKEVLIEVSPAMCTGGFLHGVLETHMATHPDFIIDEKSISHICRDILTDSAGGWFAERSCAHNLGHLMLIQEENNISETVKSCNNIVDHEFQYDCLSGAFMERLTAENLIAHDLTASKPAWNEAFARNTEKVCSGYSGPAERACWNELSYIYTSVSNYDPQRLYANCQRAPSKETRDECYIYGAGNLVNSGRFKPENLMKLCHQFAEKDPLFERCMLQTIGSLLTSTTDNLEKTLNICVRTYAGYKNQCYAQILTILARNKAPQRLTQEACSQMPDKTRAQLCKE